MISAFQSDAFQYDAFQEYGGASSLWVLIDDTQVPAWSLITTPSGTWSDIVTTQAPVWVPVIT